MIRRDFFGPPARGFATAWFDLAFQHPRRAIGGGQTPGVPPNVMDAQELMQWRQKSPPKGECFSGNTCPKNDVWHCLKGYFGVACREP